VQDKSTLAAPPLASMLLNCHRKKDEVLHVGRNLIISALSKTGGVATAQVRFRECALLVRRKIKCLATSGSGHLLPVAAR
jgi:hypothetical protein